MTRQEQITFIMNKNNCSYAQAAYYVDHVLGMVEEWNKITNG